MATLKDVAQAAGVSVTTVSHVVNGTRRVNEETAKRVEQAVGQLHYAPNAVARSLKHQRTSSIGMLVPSNANPFFAEVVAGVEEECYRLGYQLLLSHTADDEQRQVDCLIALVQRQVDGLILLSTRDSDSLRQALQLQSRLPLLFLDTDIVGVTADRISIDSELGGCLATEHLIETGHREIGFLGAVEDHPQVQSRMAGFRYTLAKHQLPLNSSWILPGQLDADSGYQAMVRLLRQGKCPTAVLAANDLMAIGALRALSEAGLSVPEDMALIGYDDIGLAGYTTPPLTTVRQPGRIMGGMAAKALSRRIDSGQQPVSRLLQPELIFRQTTMVAASVACTAVRKELPAETVA